MSDYIFSARSISNGAFTNDVDSTTHYLSVPDGANAILPSQETDQDTWVKNLIADIRNNGLDDILIFVHGYNENEGDILNHHNTLKQGLATQNFKGMVVSFDWPCANKALMYLDDRNKATMTAIQLGTGGIGILAAQQNNNCKINVHVLAHSTGAFVVREAFENAQNAKLATDNWVVNQLMFISGDISSKSMNIHSGCDAMYDHCIRLTNYFNPYDAALAMSNLKRFGFENRVGRVGLPEGAPDKCVDVDCGPWYQTIQNNSSDPFYSHGWAFDPKSNAPFIKDLNLTIQGNVDRNVMITRQLVNGKLTLVNK
jgi:hypothetical protein